MWLSRLTEWLVENRLRVMQGIAVLLTTFLYVAAFPPVGMAEGAFIFLVPFFWWLRLKPSYKAVTWTSLGMGWLAWFILIFWLRHVTFFGMAALAGVMACFFVAWSLASAWMMRRVVDSGNRWMGLMLAFGAAGAWVVMEWIRTWFLTGFPWLPLATSQWNRPILLQGATVFGQWGVSFMLVMFNVGVAGYTVRIVEWAREKKKSYCPEFYVALSVMVGMTFFMARISAGQQREELMGAAVMQPLIPQDQKWDSTFAREIMGRIEDLSLPAKHTGRNIQALFWPEAVLPYPLKGDARLRAWSEGLANEANLPIFAGAIAVERPEENGDIQSPLGYDDGDLWYNSVFLIRPEWGLYPKYYSKRHLVPFGEYVPMRSVFPWAAKVVPLDGDFSPGDSPLLLPLDLEGKTVKIGSLVCYEDVFPGLARESNLAGAGMFFVATNSAWYGRSGAAAQHMAHSVLRAVENRRIVLRVGNDAWTGWINEYGQVVDELPQWEQLAASFQLSRDRDWVGQLTVYARYGDWFVWACWGMVVVCGVIGWRIKTTDGH